MAPSLHCKDSSVLHSPLLSTPPQRNSHAIKASICLLSFVLLFGCILTIVFDASRSSSSGHSQDQFERSGFLSSSIADGIDSSSSSSSSRGNDDGAEFPFYTPKSKEPATFHHGKRRPYSSPWNDTARESLRTSFHFQPEHNWMNDPNAPLYYNGWYHLFYQYNPHDAFWGLISWGHAVSVDLIHWLYLDLAMVPDEWYDIRGVWTGSATFMANGTPQILYTGSTNTSVQVQNLAYPSDPTDFLLRNWTKVSQNPVLEPPNGILSTDFRDPTTAWLGNDGLWRMAIGSKVNDTGIALIYQSSDFLSWTLQDGYLHQVEGTGMWECLDFYPILRSGSDVGVDTSAYGDDVKHVIKASMDNTKLDFYTIGTYDYENYTFSPDSPPADLGLGLRYDYGKFYASKTFYDESKGRRILWGWINESDSLQNDIEKGWASIQALPRQVWFDNATQSNLIQWPVEEFSDLRRSNVSVNNVVLENGSLFEVSGGSGAQWDIEITIDNPIPFSSWSSSNDTSTDRDEMFVINHGDEAIYSCAEVGSTKQGYYGPFGLLVLASEDLQEHTSVYFYFTYIDGKWAALVCNDQSRSSLAEDVDKSIYGSFVPLLENENTLSLRVVVDHSIVETFAQGGRVCITSRVYPTIALEDSANLFLFNNGTTPITVQNLNAWQISKVYMHPFFALQ